MKLTKTMMFAILGVGALVVGLGVGIGAGYAIGDSSSSSSSTTTSGDFSDAILVTDGGTINDKSFNQQAYDAIKILRNYSLIVDGDDVASDFDEIQKYRGTSQDLDIYFQPNSTSANDIATQYAASDQKINGDPIILVPGFHHVAAIERYQQDNPNSKTMFVLADSAAGTLKRTLGINFNTKDAAFYTGYLAGLYLEAMDDSTPKVGTWGGGNFAGVTDFMVGFVAGVRYYNDNNGTNPDITFSKFASDDLYTNTGFGAGEGRDNANFLVGDDVDIIFPVAGPQTADAIAAINASDRADEIKVIGVDVDQSKIYDQDSNKFISSVLKNVKKALIVGYLKVKSEKIANGDFTSETWNAGFEGGYTDYAKQFETSTTVGSSTWGDLYTKLSAVTNVGNKMVKDKTLNEADWADALAYVKAN